MVTAAKRFVWSPDGKRFYFRRKGKLVRFSAVPGTEEFDREYWDIMRGRVAPKGTSWAELVASYRASDRWLGLKSRTRADYEKILEYILDKNGRRDGTTTRRADVIAAMEANRHRTRFANYIPSVMSQVFEHAQDLGLMTSNPAKGVRRLKVPTERQRRHVPWPDWAVDKFRAEARPAPLLVFEVGVGSVQRPSDWLSITWDAYDGDSLSLVQSKTGVPLVIPCTAALRAALDRHRPKVHSAGVPILTGINGGRMTYYSMAYMMLRERKRLGVAAFDLHALRYRGVQELTWAGCSDEEIAAYSGHESIDMIRLYAGEARQVMRAMQAREKRP